MKWKKWVSPRSQKGGSLIEVLAAIIIVGVGIALFMRVQGRSTKDSYQNSKMLVAGKMVERLLEDTRIQIFKDTVAYWPPKDTTILGSAPNFISLKRKISDANSPKDGAVVNNVKKLVITATWTQPQKDSLEITTYVSKRF
jgi:prepilin-type N-terminal cleavage/methylation domain-containing protein